MENSNTGNFFFEKLCVYLIFKIFSIVNNLNEADKFWKIQIQEIFL